MTDDAGATVELRSDVPGHGDSHVARKRFEVETEDTAEKTRPWHPGAYVVVHPMRSCRSRPFGLRDDVLIDAGIGFAEAAEDDL